jgi:hypothetical protein
MPNYARLSDAGEVESVVGFVDEQPLEGIRKHPNGQYAMLPLVEGPRPEYDRATHKLVGPKWAVKASHVVRSHEVVALSPEERADRVALGVRHMDAPTLGLVRTLADRVRALEKKPPLSDNEFSAWCAHEVQKVHG